MITKRLGIVLGALALGLGSVYALPSKTKTQQAGIVLELPRFIAPGWTGEEVPVSEVERKALAADTGFARRRYLTRSGDAIFLGIVLSGEDMANSIHRPERCLIAQGWSLQPPVTRRVPLTENGGTVETTRIVHTQGTTFKGTPFVRRDMTYYWFVGSRDQTGSHFARTFIDIRDRLLRGENQRWAYITAQCLVTESVPENLRGRGFVPRTEEETARVLEEFLARAVPTFVKPPDGDAGGGLAAAN